MRWVWQTAVFHLAGEDFVHYLSSELGLVNGVLSAFPTVLDEALDATLEFIVERSPGSAAISHAQAATDGKPRLRRCAQLFKAKFFANEDNSI